MRKQYIFGNWKMNNTLSESKEFFAKAEASLKNADLSNTVMGIAIPSLNLLEVKKIANNIQVAAQNVHHEDKGAFTGEISVTMLNDTNIKYCVVGHSERREMFNETDAIINAKVIKLLANEITPIFCLGETEIQYNEGETKSVVEKQIELGFLNLSDTQAQQVVVAYEPIWAIGTGKTATPEIAQNTIKVIREKLAQLYNEEIANSISILYGGSVKPTNINEIMAQKDIDGALVGGASVEAESFVDLYKNK